MLIDSWICLPMTLPMPAERLKRGTNLQGWILTKCRGPKSKEQRRTQSLASLSSWQSPWCWAKLQRQRARRLWQTLKQFRKVTSQFILLQGGLTISCLLEGLSTERLQNSALQLSSQCKACQYKCNQSKAWVLIVVILRVNREATSAVKWSKPA